MRHALLAAALFAAACTTTDRAERRESVSDAATVPQLAGSDGESHSLAELTARGPVYLYFIKKDCPINAQALPHYQRLHEGLGEPASFVGVINGDRAVYEAWSERHDAGFLVLLDPDKTWIRHFEAQRSPWVVEVRRDGTPGRAWKGYGAKELGELNVALADSAKRKPAQLDTTGLPESGRFG